MSVLISALSFSCYVNMLLSNKYMAILMKYPNIFQANFQNIFNLFLYYQKACFMHISLYFRHVWPY